MGANMEAGEAWNLVGYGLDVGLQAAHGAGLIDRHKVSQINEAQEATMDYMNGLARENAELRAANEDLAGRLQAATNCIAAPEEGRGDGDTSGSNSD